MVRNDQIVLMSLLPGEDGKAMTHEAIAKKFGMTRSNISTILKSDEAKEMMEAARERVRENLLDDVKGSLTLLQKLAVKRIKVTLDADINAIHKAKPNQDRAAFRLLEGQGILKKESEDGQEGGLRVSPDQMAKLLGALEKSDRVKEIDPFENVPDADFEILENGTGTNG